MLPNVEFRASVFVDGSRVNFHIIFSEELEPGAIEEHFLRELKFIAESNPDSKDDRWSLTITNLEELGRKLKNEHEKFKGKSDLYIGMMNAVVSIEDVTSILESQASRFKDCFLIVVPVDEDLSRLSWDGQGHQTRKLFIQKSHMLFSPNPNTREFGLGLKHPTKEAFLREFKSFKPCVHGSDSHSFDRLFEPSERRYLWIKADPTFQGLHQILHEPATRIYIGLEPPFFSRISENATRYMDSISFERTESAEEDEVWFSGTVPLSYGLVAVIGNKGSGKSAFTDILALLGNTHNSDHFSFLNKDRFLTPKKNLGNMFSAKVLWKSGRLVSRLLSESVDPTAPELVKYIPQNYLENICNEIKESNESRFYYELMEIIFSHVSDAERLGKESLVDLIEYLTNEKEARISQLIKELSSINAKIVALEGQITDEYRQSLEAEIQQRRLELEAHTKAKPPEVKQPRKDPQLNVEARAITEKIDELKKQSDKLDKEIAEEKLWLEKSELEIAAAKRLLDRIENLEANLQKFYKESVGDSQILKIDIKQIVSLQIRREPILDVKKKADVRNKSARVNLDVGREDSLEGKRKVLHRQIEEYRSKLDEPNRRYQEYCEQLANWGKKHKEIEDSYKKVKDKLTALENKIPDQINNLKEKRKNIVKSIFGIKKQLLDDYCKLYFPVQEFIDKHPVAQQGGLKGSLEFSASIMAEGFADGFLDMIHQGRIGSFQGEKEGRQRLVSLLEHADFSSDDGVLAFLESIQEHFDYDKRDEKNRPVRLEHQLRHGITSQNIYDFLYGLSYLKPRFELRWQGKSLDQLSPGERGSLLLIFYLLIDKRDVPLIIDQPEENLDNQTIATILVPAIKYAKDRRQIVIVTHNPNLAVVCDADQIIHAHLDKNKGNQITYTSGSIENPTITQLIVDVLEGTKPAFDLRDAKYEVLERPM